MSLSQSEVAILITAKNQAEAQLAQLQRQFQEIGTGATGLHQKLSTLGSAFAGGLGIGAGLAVVQTGITALAGAMSAVGDSTIGMNARLEQSKVAFSTMLGSAEAADAFLRDLARFAQTSPFGFESLLDASKRMLAFGFTANETRPLIESVGKAVAAFGGGKAEIDRVTNALGQMRAATVVQLGEMNQLTEVGIPAFEILAKAMGKSTAEVKDLISQGKIASDVFINAFQAWTDAKFGDILARQSKTFSGAMEGISDSLKFAAANAAKPFFDLLSSGAVQVAEFLQGDNFQTWANALRVAFEGGIAWAGQFLSALAPIGQAISLAFQQLTAGDFAGAWQTVKDAATIALGGIWNAVTAFATDMFGAGANLIGTFASGILEGAGSVLMSAINTVADIIASFLIGNSPPPEGPLSQIQQGGANVMAAWGAGAEGAAASAVKPAVDIVAGEMDRLKESGKSADQAIREIGRSIQELESETRGLKNQVEDITSAYRDQLDPLEAQLDALTKVKDMEAERQKLAFSQEESALRSAEIAALGDPVLRRELQARLATLKARQDEVRTARELADAERASAGSEKDRLRDQLEAQRAAREESDLRSKLKDAKGPEKARIQAQLAELEIRKQIAAVDDKEKAEKASRAKADAEARAEELRTRQQLEGLADKEALADIARQKEELKARKDAFSLQQEQQRVEREMAALPIRQEIERIKAEQEATLKPLKDQIEVLSRQKENLTEQRQYWQGIKSDIGAATTALKDQAKAAQEAAQARSPAAVPFTADAAVEAAVTRAREAGARLAGELRDAFTNLFSGETIGALIDGQLAIAFGPERWARVRAAVDQGVQNIRDSWATIGQVFQNDWSPDASIQPFTNAIGQIALVVRDQVWPAVKEVGAFIVQEFQVVVDWVKENWPLIVKSAQTVFDAIVSIWSGEGGGGSLANVVKVAWELVKLNIDTVLKNILAFVKIQLQLLTGDWQGAWQTFVRIVNENGNAIETAYRLIFGGTQSALEAWATAQIESWTAWGNETLATVTAAIDGLNALWVGFGDFIGGQMDAIRTLIKGVWDLIPEDIRLDLELILTTLIDRGAAWVAALVDTGTQMATTIAFWLGEIIKSLTTWARETFLGPLHRLTTDSSEAANDIGFGISDVLGSWWAFIVREVTNFIEWFTRPLRNAVYTVMEIASDIGNAIIDGIADAIKSGAYYMKETLLRIVREAISAAKNLLNLNFSGSGSSIFSGRADGGPVTAGRPYVVGERGIPELFVPSQSGRIETLADLSRMLGIGGGAQAAVAGSGDTIIINARGVGMDEVAGQIAYELRTNASLRGNRRW